MRKAGFVIVATPYDQRKIAVAEEQRQKTAQLEAELLRLQLELERYKRWYYGPRADRLRTVGELAQLLLQFSEELDRRPVAADELVSPQTEPEQALRRVKRRKADAIWPASKVCPSRHMSMS
jgi:multidrug efflux pump subunit AcrA (membrane-fusion protein)